MVLDALNRVDDEDAQAVEEQHRERIEGPGHFAGVALSRHPGEAIDQPLERAEDLLEKDRLALVHARHVPAERLDEGEEHDEVEGDLRVALPVHENASGLSRATKR